MTSLLALVGIAADLLASREHVLLSNLIEHAWRGRDLDLGTLIGEIQAPPIRKSAASMSTSSSHPQTARSSPSRSTRSWPHLRRVERGRATRSPAPAVHRRRGSRAAPSSTSPISRRKSASSSSRSSSRSSSPGCAARRARPTSARSRTWTRCSAMSLRRPLPPAKKPILTIFKQGRAFGLGLVLSTNPVDLDYKAMANAGTWLVGRLHGERQGACARRPALGGGRHRRCGAGPRDRRARQRQFLLVSAKASAPRPLTTRWAMSYLCGLLTKEQVARLAPDRPQAAPPRLKSLPSLLGSSPPTTSVAPAVAREPRGVPRSSRALGDLRSAPSPARRGYSSSSRRVRRATTTAPRASTSSRSSRRCTACSLPPSTSRARGRSTTTIATSATTHRRTPSTCCPARRSTRRASSSRRRRRSSATSSTGGRSSWSGTGR